MASVSELVSVLRRRIGDTDTPFEFDDSLLIGYLSDSLNDVKLEYSHNYAIGADELFVNSQEPTDVEDALFIIRAHFLFVLRQKDKADRNNFRMMKGRLRLDNRGQSADHFDTLNLLETEYRRALYRAKSGGKSINGIRVE